MPRRRLSGSPVPLLLLAGILVLWPAAAIADTAWPVQVVGAVLTSDNGDQDGWADTNETVDVNLRLFNRSGMDLTGVVAHLLTDDPMFVCISDPIVDVGFLADGAIVLSADTATLMVADVARVSVDEWLTGAFRVEIWSDQLGLQPADQETTLDLDLSAVGGSGPTTFFESFESGFGTFTTMHLDEPLNPPDGDLDNDAKGRANSDGYRCQYTDPEWWYSNTYGSGAAARCYLNVTGRPDAYWFHTTDDRASHGAASLHWGSFVDETRGFTSPLAQLEAIRTIDPIHLGWNRVCELDRSIVCETEAECPIDQRCVPEAPVLSFKHQISLADHRSNIPPQPDRSADRAVVHGQLVDDAGDPLSEWVKLVPFVNVYDSQANSNYFKCTFDPVDDGNSEESFFDPTDPERRYGPSSTCMPAFTYAHQGDTGIFDPAAIGDASDGPGLEGSVGTGTWVEPRFDLERFRGRGMRLRFMATSLKLSSGGYVTWDDYYEVVYGGFNPDPREDGWFIDEVTVTDTRAEPASIIVDSNENLDLKYDWDLDSFGLTCDCSPHDASVWALPAEAGGLELSHVGGMGGTTTLTWQPPAWLGGDAVEYDTLRSVAPDDFVNGLVCVESADGADTTAIDTADPAGGSVFYYLIRAGNSCGGGALQNWHGLPRAGGGCG